MSIPTPNYEIRPLREEELGWLVETLRRRWGPELVVGGGKVRELAELNALVAFDEDELVGLVTFAVEGHRAELVTLDAFRQGAGVGRQLLEALAGTARDQGLTALVVMTTNDNLRALRLYQLAGFRLDRLVPGSMEEVREQHSWIPAVGHDEIPVRDEIYLVRSLRETPKSIP